MIHSPEQAAGSRFCSLAATDGKRGNDHAKSIEQLERHTDTSAPVGPIAEYHLALNFISKWFTPPAKSISLSIALSIRW